MKGVLAVSLFVLFAPTTVFCEDSPGPFSAIDSVAAPTLLGFLADGPDSKAPASPDADPADPGPESAPPFPSGFRPEPWEAWEIPEAMKRISFWIFAGSTSFTRKTEVLEMDNPSLFMTGSEIVEWDAIWENGTFGATLHGGIAVFPALRAVLEVDFFLFNREASLPSIYVVYVDANENQRLLSADAFRGARAVLCAQLEFPVNDVLFEPGNLFRWKRPKDSSGFVPFVLFGAGVSYFEKATVRVYITEGGTGRSEKRTLFERTIGPAVQAGVGMAYRVSFIGIAARAFVSYNGIPGSGWRPYTDSAEAVVTYSLQLGVGAYFG